MSHNDFDKIINRLKQVTEVSTDKDLADKLGVPKQSVASARKFKRVPEAWLSKIAQSYGVSLDWLKWGTLGLGLLAAPAVMSTGIPLMAGKIIGSLVGGGLATSLLTMKETFGESPDKSAQPMLDEKKLGEFLRQVDAQYIATINSLESELQEAKNRVTEMELEKKEFTNERRDWNEERKRLTEQNQKLWLEKTELLEKISKLEMDLWQMKIDNG